MTTKKALVVDDSKLAQFVLKNMLIQHKVEVHTAESAEEALGYLSHQKPDVIFMDHTMPGMDGLEALKVIKENPDTATIPVLMYTSQSDGVYINQAKALGATDILPKQLKPIELQQLLKKLRLIDDTDAPQQPVKETQSVKETKVQQRTSNKQTTTTSEIEELSKLLREAESALEKETLKQFVQQELEKQHRRSTTILQKINRGLNELNYARSSIKSETHSPATRKLGSLLWPLLLIIVVLVFGLLYFQFQQSLSSLQQTYNDRNVDVDEEIQPQFSTIEAADDRIDKLLEDIKQTFNTNSRVALNEPLLGKQSMERVAFLIAPLKTAAFKGEVQLIAHTGNFCVISDVAENRVVASDETPIDECNITESNITIKQMMTEEFRKFIEDINNNKDNGFYITVDSRGGEEPLMGYPNIGALTTAGEWNAIAKQNRRVEVVLRHEG